MAQVEALKIDTSEATKSLKTVRKELMAIKSEMTNLEEGSDAFLKAANRAGELKHQLDEINESVSGASADFGDLLSTSSAALNGIIGGLTAAQGALSLFGIENEDVIKSIKQLQSLMAIGQGISQIDSGIKALGKLQHAVKGTTTSAKLLKSVLQPKSILLLTAAIAALLKLWEKYSVQIKESIPLLGKISDKWTEITTGVNEATKAQEEYNKTVSETQNKLDVFVKDNKIKKLNSDAKKSYDELGTQITELQLRIENLVAQQKKPGIGRTQWEELNKQGIELVNTMTQLKNAQRAILDDPNSYKQQEKTKETVKTVKNDLNDILTKLNNTGKNLLKDPANPFVQRDAELTSPLEHAELALTRLDAQYVQGELTAKEYYDAVIEWEEFKLTQIDKNTEAYYKQQIVIAQTKQAAVEATTEMKAGWQDWTMVAQTGISSISSVLSGLADLQDTTTKEGIEKQAQYQYMAAVMNTANAIIGAWTSAMSLPAPVSFILGGIQTAAAAAMGAIEIAKIKKAAQQAQASLSGSSASVSSGALSSAVIAPIQYSSATQGAQLQSSITDTRVYVTENDITRTQNKVRVAESENRF